MDGDTAELNECGRAVPVLQPLAEAISGGGARVCLRPAIGSCCSPPRPTRRSAIGGAVLAEMIERPSTPKLDEIEAALC